MNRIERRKLIKILAWLVVFSAVFCGCSETDQESSGEKEQESVVEQEEVEFLTQETESSEEEATVPDEGQLGLLKTFARGLYGSESIRNLTFAGESKHDGTVYTVYSFSNILGEEITVHLADDSAVTKDMYVVDYTAEDGTEILRKVCFEEEIYLDRSVTGERYTDADYAAFASKVAESFMDKDDDDVSVEYSGNEVIRTRMLRVYLVSDGTRIAFDDKMNNICRSSGEEEEVFVSVIEEEEDRYVLDPAEAAEEETAE